MESGKKTREIFKRAQQCMPLGVTSNYRYWGDDKSLVIKKGEGAYIWDQDDKRYGERLKAGFNKVLRERGIPGFVQGPAAMPAVVLTEEESISDFRQMAAVDLEIYQKIIWKLIEKAVMPDTGVHEPWFISASHTDSDADFAIGAFEEALKEVKV